MSNTAQVAECIPKNRKSHVAKASCIRARFLCATFGCASKIRFLQHEGGGTDIFSEYIPISRAHLRINYRGFSRSHANASVRARVNCKRLIVSVRKNPRNARYQLLANVETALVNLRCHVSAGNAMKILDLWHGGNVDYRVSVCFIDISIKHICISLLVISSASLPWFLWRNFYREEKKIHRRSISPKCSVRWFHSLQSPGMIWTRPHERN